MRERCVAQTVAASGSRARSRGWRRRRSSSRRGRVEAELGGDRLPVELPVQAGEGARAERHRARGPAGGREAVGVARGASRTRRAGGGRARRAGRAAGGCSRASRQSRWRPARSSSVSRRPRAARCAAPARSATNSARSVATWSLRERPVWSLPPSGPTISVSRRSIAMWMSSSASSKGNSPPSARPSTASRPARASASSSSAVEDAGAEQRPGVGARPRRRRAPGGDRTPARRSAARRRDRVPARSGARRRECMNAAADARPAHRCHRQDRQRRRPAASSSAATRSSRWSGTRPGARSCCRRRRAGARATSPTRVAARAAEGVEAAINCDGDLRAVDRRPRRLQPGQRRGRPERRVAAREAGAARIVHTSTFDVFDAAARRHGQRGPRRRLRQGHGLRALQAARRAPGRSARREPGIEVVLVNPPAIIGPGPWAAASAGTASSRDASAAACRSSPPGGMTHDLGRRCGRRPCRRPRPRPAGRALHRRRRLRLDSRDLRVAVEEAGRGRVPRAIPSGWPRPLAAPASRSPRTGKPPLMPAGQLEFLLWEARADSVEGPRELGIEPLDWRRRSADDRWMIERGRAQPRPRTGLTSSAAEDVGDLGTTAPATPPAAPG